MSHVMEDTFEVRMGGERLTRGEVAALEGWLDGLPAVAATVDEDAAARGRDVFERAECGSCHAGALGTQRASVIMPEAGHLQVPLLVGVGVRGPFLHDGCAATLDEALLGCGGRGPHPGVEGLDEGERADLVAFLAGWD
ncbi:MAG: hypothetical protein KF901_33485 [Myxococcales bacterium]|nr:hypothetical protein [Myxococcales bacterium]